MQADEMATVLRQVLSSIPICLWSNYRFDLDNQFGLGGRDYREVYIGPMKKNLDTIIILSAATVVACAISLVFNALFRWAVNLLL
jgi:hypothetical protein